MADSLPVTESLDFTVPASASGNYHYFNLNMFTGLETNPFVANERKTDVFFGTKQLYSIMATVELPEDMKMDELPKNVKLIMPDTSIIFQRRSSFSGNYLSVSIKLEFRAPMYGAPDYGYFQEFYKKLFELLNESYVYTKK